MRDGVRKRIWVAALAALAALGFVRGQITGGSGDGSLFLPFSGVLDYTGGSLMGTTSGSDPYGYTQPPPPDPVRADCVRLGIPVSLQVNQVGTTTSPFCPGVAGAWANAGGDWTVSFQGGPAGQQVTTTAQVRSYGTTTVTVYYTYNPPQPSGGDSLVIVVGQRAGENRVYYNNQDITDWWLFSASDAEKQSLLSYAGGVGVKVYDVYGNLISDWFIPYPPDRDPICYYDVNGCP